MLFVAEGRDVAVAICVAVKDRDGSKAVQQIFYTRVDRTDAVVAWLAVELVILDGPGDGENDIATKLVIHSELETDGNHTRRAGVRCLRDELLRLEVDIEQ